MNIKTALVVDDSRVARLTLSKLLKGRSIQVEQVNSAQEALDYLNKIHPDVVFMDYLMPDMDGLEATRLISTNPATASIPVVICSAEEAGGIVHKAEGQGAWGFLTKPAPEERLDTLLQELSQKTPINQPFQPPVPVSAATAPAGAITLQDVQREALAAAETVWQQSAQDRLRRLIDESVRSLFESQRGTLEQSTLEGAKKAAREMAESVAEISAKTIARQVAQEVAGEAGANAARAAAETVARREARAASKQLAESIRHELDIRFDEIVNDEAQRETLMHTVSSVAAQTAESVARSTANAAVEALRVQHRDSERSKSEGQMNTLVEIKAEAQQTISAARKLLLVSGLVLMLSMGSTLMVFLR